MIGAIAMIFCAIWLYRSGVKAKTENLFMWMMVCMAVFFASQFLMYFVNAYLTDLVNGKDIASAGYERDLTDVGDRKNAGGFQSGGGAVFSVFLELFPATVGFLLMALMRIFLITKEAFSVNNLFSGITEIFQDTSKQIVDSVKEGIKK